MHTRVVQLAQDAPPTRTNEAHTRRHVPQHMAKFVVPGPAEIEKVRVTSGVCRFENPVGHRVAKHMKNAKSTI